MTVLSLRQPAARFLFGQCPTGFEYLWRPIEGSPAFEDQFDEPRVNADVWEARDEIVKTENLNPRLLEIALRTALICAAADGRRELLAADLHCGLHAFRHTHTSLLLEVGAPPTVAQAQLRHSDPRITLAIYGHVIGIRSGSHSKK